MFESALVSGITSMGLDAVLVGGVLPTPAIAYITRGLRLMPVLLYPHLITSIAITELNSFQVTDSNCLTM